MRSAVERRSGRRLHTIRDASASGRDPLLTVGVIGALSRGAAVVLAFTNRGRNGGQSRRRERHAAAGPAGRRTPAPEGAIPRIRRRASPARSIAEVETPTLYGVSGEYAGVELELSDEPVVIGRDPRVNQLVFSADTAGVSGRHC